MTIGEVAEMAGVSTSAIRYYESAGILPKPPRRSGIRDYDASIVERLAVIRFFRAGGMSIESIAAMFAQDRYLDRHAVVEQRIAELDEFIREARAMKRRLRALLACRCEGDSGKCVIFA